MNNIYLLESDNYLLLDIKIDEILKQNHFKKEDLITYDLEEVNVSNAILDLDTYSLFNERKAVYCKSATFLTSLKSEINHDINGFIKYIQNPNLNNILIISCSKIDMKNKVSKELKKVAQFEDLQCDLCDYVKKRCGEYKINKETINYFLESTGNDICRITNELDKLLALKKDEKEIVHGDIDLVVLKKIDSNIFDLIDAIINKNKSKSLKIYENMINYGEDIFKIFISLTNQIRLIYQVKILKNLSNDEIANLLNLKNPKQVVALRYKIDKYNKDDLINYLYKLSIMDENLKSGKIIDKISFPIFIASL